MPGLEDSRYREMLPTHYDRLKIARDAPIEVVRAAYRVLCLKYHPDRNPGDSEAARRMVLLNAAYKVLSDPDKRREHDAWIESMESASRNGPARESNLLSRYPAVRPVSARPGGNALSNRALAYLGSYTVWFGIALLVALALWGGSALRRAETISRSIVPLRVVQPEIAAPPRSAASETRQLWLSSSSSPAQAADQSSSAPTLAAPLPPMNETPAPTQSSAPSSVDNTGATSGQKAAPTKGSQSNPRIKPPVARVPSNLEASIPARSERHEETQPRADKAPNGEPWPPKSAYVRGYEILYTNGGSQLVLDNSHNNFDVFLKVVSVTDPEPKTIRSVFVLAHGQFQVSNLRNGSYEVWYQQLGSGTLLRSSTFALEESAIAGGTRYSIVTMPLQMAADESANAYPLTAEEFEQ
jgi:hypothetical protein